MKKIVYLSLLAGLLLSSCNYESPKFKALKATKDSLQNVYDQRDQEATEYLSIINEVEENFAKIKEAEGYFSENVTNAETTSVDYRAKVQADLTVITNLVAQNRAKIADLEAKLIKSNGRFAALNGTIRNLRAQLSEKESLVESLQAQIGEKDMKIQELDSTVVVLNTDLTELGIAKAAADSIADALDKDLNAGYYFLGTSKELKNSGIVIKKGINKSKFTKIDIREVATIDLDSKAGLVLTTHPAGSYRINVVEKKASLTIINPSEFWSISKYLVVKTK